MEKLVRDLDGLLGDLTHEHLRAATHITIRDPNGDLTRDDPLSLGEEPPASPQMCRTDACGRNTHGETSAL